MANDIHSLDLLCNLSKVHILIKEEKHKDAEELLWLCYEQSQKSHRRKYMFPHLFCILGDNYTKKGDFEQATIFLNLANKSINPLILKKMHKTITKYLSNLKDAITNNYDIVVNLENKIIVEKTKRTYSY